MCTTNAVNYFLFFFSQLFLCRLIPALIFHMPLQFHPSAFDSLGSTKIKTPVLPRSPSCLIHLPSVLDLLDQISFKSICLSKGIFISRRTVQTSVSLKNSRGRIIAKSKKRSRSIKSRMKMMRKTGIMLPYLICTPAMNGNRSQFSQTEQGTPSRRQQG